MRLQLTTIISLFVLTAGVQAQSFSDRAQSEKYQECLVQVEENSAAAILGARKWYIEGGAVAAQHCEALALYDQKRYGEAASLFEAIVGKLAREEGAGDFARQNKDVLTVQLNYLAGLAWHSDENYDKAYNALNSAIVGLDVGSEYGYELYIERGLVQVASENYEDALSDFTKALELNSEMIDAYLYRAETFRKINEHLKARLDLNAALVLKPSHPDVLFESGVNYRMLNNDEKALQEWEKLIAKYPNSHWQNLVQENISLIGQ
jgi:tetratricopeptide (TPR) repeat protein|tara:strand:- start:40463 stop:41254 length:792 start_codon:yes stop_codon:yes gene_type:complete